MIGRYVKYIDGLILLIAKYSSITQQWYCISYVASNEQEEWTGNTKKGFVRYLKHKTVDYLQNNPWHGCVHSEPTHSVTFQSLRCDLKCERMDQTTNEEIAIFFYYIAAFLFHNRNEFEDEFHWLQHDKDWLMDDLAGK